jgi:ribonuclease T1
VTLDRRTWIVAAAIAVIAAFLGWQHVADDSPSPGSLPVVSLGQLPSQAVDTVALIDSGGPFPYDQDDSVFGNFEGLLPDEPRGYYREYTVVTPGSGDRGARRIIAGESGELYWTDDHYQSFSRILR